MTPAARSVRSRWSPAGLAWALWALAVLGLAPVAWLDHLLRQTSRADLLLIGPGDIPFMLATLSAATVGAVVATRRPRHPVGWLLLAFGLSVPVAGVLQGYVRYGLLARPGALPAAPYVAPYTVAIPVAWLVCIGFVLLLTPGGSLPSPRWRWWARIAMTAPVVFLVSQVFGAGWLDPQLRSAANPLAVPALAGPLRAAAGVAAAIASLSLVVAAGSIVVRVRHASGAARRQLRWLAAAATSAVVMVGAVLAVSAGTTTASLDVIDLGVGVCVALLPLAIGAAVLKYRLYDLDRILSRTIAYGLLTVLLGGGYAVVVLGLGQLLGRDSSLVVAGATLAAAALFQPALRRIQQAVDRRFNRRSYDAFRTIQAFSARLRQHVDLNTLTAELLAVVDQTMQPTQVSLWLRPPGSASQSRSGAGASRAALQLTAASRSAHTAL